MSGLRSLADGAARLIRTASGARTGAGAAVAPDVATALKRGTSNVRTLLIVALVVTASWCCCCSSPWVALFSGDDGSIESTDYGLDTSVTPSWMSSTTTARL